MLKNLRKEIICNADGCFDSDWDKIYKAMQEVFSTLAKAHREGILSLEENLDEIENKDFKYFLRFILEGTDADTIEEYIENMYYANSPRGSDGIIFLIYAYGALYIQAGASTDSTELLFQSLVPSDYRDKIQYDEERDRKLRGKQIEQAIKNNSLGDVINFEPTDDSFSHAMMSLPDDEFKILRNVWFDENYWARALKYSSTDLLNRIIKQKSIDAIVYFADSINSENCTQEDSDKAKEIILSTLADIKWKESMALEGKATEAFELGSIEDDFSKKIMELSDEQIKMLIQKVEETDLRHALNFTILEVINKFAANMDFTKLFSVCNNLAYRSKWEKKEANESKGKLLSALEKEVCPNCC